MLEHFNAATLRGFVTRIDWVALMSIALVGIFVITLLTSYIFPIYPDEIATRFWLSRLPYDFPEKITNLPTCVSGFSQHIPATWYMPGLVNWALHGNLESLHAFRQVGFLVAFLWVAGLALYLRSRARDSMVNEGRALNSCRLNLLTAGLFIAVFSIGVFPIFLISNRHEQLMLPSVVLLLFIFLAGDRLEIKGQPWQKLGLTVMYFVAVSLVLYGHPKGLFLTPFFAIVGWQLFRSFNSRPLFISAMALLGLHVAQAYVAWKYSFQCSEAPRLEALLKSFSFDPAALFYDPHLFFDQAYHSLLNFKKYLYQLSFQPQTDIGYLAPFPLGPFAKFANVFIRLDFAMAFFAILVLLPLRYYRKDIVGGRLVTINAALLILLVSLLVSAVFNLPKNWYDAGYIYALLSIIWIFFIGENFRGIFQKTAARRIYFYLACVALLSQAVFIHRNLPAFWSGYAGPGIPIVKYVHDAKSRDDLAASSRACNIDPVQSKGVIVDDYTYFYYQKSQRPMPITYIFVENDPESIRRFISEADSSGLVVRCSVMPVSYIPFAKKTGDVCCIPREALKNLPAP